MEEVVVKFEQGIGETDTTCEINQDLVTFFSDDKLLSLRFSEIQIIYKAMCDLRFERKEDEM